MENASKALLIAGAVLIAIVLVTLGIVILGGAGKSKKAATDTATSITAKMVNIKFKKYIEALNKNAGEISKNELLELCNLVQKYGKTLEYIRDPDNGKEIIMKITDFNSFINKSGVFTNQSKSISINKIVYDENGEILNITVDRELSPSS